METRNKARAFLSCHYSPPPFLFQSLGISVCIMYVERRWRQSPGFLSTIGLINPDQPALFRFLRLSPRKSCPGNWSWQRGELRADCSFGIYFDFPKGREGTLSSLVSIPHIFVVKRHIIQVQGGHWKTERYITK